MFVFKVVIPFFEFMQFVLLVVKMPLESLMLFFEMEELSFEFMVLVFFMLKFFTAMFKFFLRVMVSLFNFMQFML
jgi:hypothetical protein